MKEPDEQANKEEGATSANEMIRHWRFSSLELVTASVVSLVFKTDAHASTLQPKRIWKTYKENEAKVNRASSACEIFALTTPNLLQPYNRRAGGRYRTSFPAMDLLRAEEDCVVI